MEDFRKRLGLRESKVADATVRQIMGIALLRRPKDREAVWERMYGTEEPCPTQAMATWHAEQVAQPDQWKRALELVTQNMDASSSESLCKRYGFLEIFSSSMPNERATSDWTPSRLVGAWITVVQDTYPRLWSSGKMKYATQEALESYRHQQGKSLVQRGQFAAFLAAEIK